MHLHCKKAPIRDKIEPRTLKTQRLSCFSSKLNGSNKGGWDVSHKTSLGCQGFF